jgi:hypothetical protein
VFRGTELSLFAGKPGSYRDVESFADFVGDP